MTIIPLHPARDESPAARLGVISLDEIDDSPPRPLLLDRIDPDGHTILYGDGGIGKSTLAAWWAAQLAGDGHRILILDYEGREREWAYRVRMLGGRGDPMRYAAPMLHGRVEPALWAHASLVHEIADEFGITLVVVDSISAACHGVTPASDEAATKYHAALQVICRPVLSIAHVTKPRDGSDRLAKPYGSTQWHNLARVTWSLSEKDGKIALTHRKANAYERQRTRQVVITRDAIGWAVDDTRPMKPSIAEAMMDLLEDEPLSRRDLAERLSSYRADSVRKALSRAVAAGRLVEVAGEIRIPSG